MLVVGNTHDIRSSFGRFESVRHGKRNVLTVVPNHIVLEGRASLDTNLFEALTRSGTGNLSNVDPMKNRAHTWHLLRHSCVDLLDFAVGNRRFDRNRIEHSRKVVVGSVHGRAADLKRAIDTNLRFTDHGHLSVFGHKSIDSLGRLSHKLQGVDKAAFSQLNLESVLTLRFGVAQCCIGCSLENAFARGLIR